MEGQKLNEAQKLIKDAEKAAKKSWFSSPDYGIAAQFYEQAANCYKTIKYFKPSRESYILASDHFLKSNVLFMAAKATENAALMSNQLKEFDQSYELYDRAAEYYLQSGSIDTAAQLLERASKVLEPIAKDRSIEFLNKTCDIYISEDKSKFAVEAYRRCAYLLLTDKQWEAANQKLSEMKEVTDSLANPSTSNKILLTQAIVWLAYGDEIAAKKIVDFASEYKGFVGSQEYNLASKLLDFYSDGDQASWDDAVKGHASLFFDTETVNIARKLKLPGNRAPKPTKPVDQLSSDLNEKLDLDPSPTLSSNLPQPGSRADPNPGATYNQEKQIPVQEESDDDSLC